MTAQKHFFLFITIKLKIIHKKIKILVKKQFITIISQ